MVTPRSAPFVIGPKIDDVFPELLALQLREEDASDYHIVQITDPVSSINFDKITLGNWMEIVKVGNTVDRFKNFEFRDGTVGREWIENRIEELFNGLYANRLTSPQNQVQLITDRLKLGNHGQTTNALVVQVFHPDPDLKKATQGRPLAPNLPCLTQIQFKPRRNRLHLYATFRSQYIETKCYGNLLSLGLLLAEVCKRTGYEPGYILEIAFNSIFRSTKDAERLDSWLSKDDRVNATRHSSPYPQ